jgi:hypothetical protein
MPGPDLLGGNVPETLLPDDDREAREALAAGTDAALVASGSPTSSAAWAALADEAFADAQVIASYAYARTGYHRGLDALRRAGWRGQGPVPWSHEPNQGFLRCLHALARAAEAIGETQEAQRCAQFLRDSSVEAAEVLGGGR